MDAVHLKNDAVRAIRRGHPWVYADGVHESLEPGKFVRLLDRKGTELAWAISDEGGIALRVLPGQPMGLSDFLEQRLARADGIRTRLIAPDTDAYRVVNAAGDGLPGIVLDRYGGLAVVRLYSAGWACHVQAIVDAVARLPWVEMVYRRYGVKRVDGRKGGVLLKGGSLPEQLVVQEHGVRFLVRPGRGQKTGLFLDQRENRRRVGRLSAGHRVLNLFGYNGGFSVYAALGGAARVETVDVAGAALEDAKENFRLNGLSVDAHAFHAADVFKWDPVGKAGLVVCDPPSLTHAQGADGSARKAYARLNSKVSRWVTSEGLLATASCTARLSDSEWDSAVFDGVSETGRWSLLMRCGAPLDHPVALAHPEGRYLKFALLTRLAARL